MNEGEIFMVSGHERGEIFSQFERIFFRFWEIFDEFQTFLKIFL